MQTKINYGGYAKKLRRFLLTDVKIINKYLLITIILVILSFVGLTSYALFSYEVESSSSIKIVYSDLKGPVCVIDGPDVSEIGINSNANYTMNCTDNFGVIDTILTSDNFTITGDITISNIEKEQIDDDYKYTITITSGETSTTGNIKLNSNVIQDINGNYNKESNVSDDINVVTFPVYTYTGSHQFIDDGDGNWRIKFLTSGTFTLTSSDLNIDIFLVGGGGAGTYGEINYSSGGGGGYTKTIKNVNIAKDSSHSIIIGAGAQRNASYTTATGQPSYFDSYLANGGKSGAHQAGGNGGSGGGGGRLSTGGSDGGNGIRGGYSFTQGSGQGTTTREFGEAGGDIYSGGGGGGGGTDQSGGAGGAGGGGNGGKGGSESSCGNGGNGGSGTSNTGGGGGGGGKGPCTNSEDGLGGSGGSGIVIIRNAR